MDPTILQELLKQYGWTSAAIALVVSFILTAIFNLGIFYVNSRYNDSARRSQNVSGQIQKRNPEVIEAFLKVMFPTKQTDNKTEINHITDNLNALRNAIRKELGFGKG